jgi:hypothetical protein
MEILVPGESFEGYFDEPRRARAELGERYGITWHDERIPEAITHGRVAGEFVRHIWLLLSASGPA